MLVQEAVKLIQRIPKALIRELLFNCLNPEACNLGSLFNLQKENNDPSTKLIRELKKLPVGTSIVSIALTLSSKKLSDELNNALLLFKADEVITLLRFSIVPREKNKHSLTHSFKISQIDKIFTYYALRKLITHHSDDISVAFIEAIGRQPEAQIYYNFCYLFLNSEVLMPSNNSNLDPISIFHTSSLINTLNSINSNLVADLFKIDKLSSAKALALLKILTKLGKEKLMSLLVDPSIRGSGYVTSPTILHIIFEKYPLEVIQQCFILLSSFSSGELENFFPSLRDSLKTPLHYLFARNEDRLTNELIKLIHSKPHLKKLLLKCRWHATDNSPMHEAVQNGNIVAITYLLEHETLNPRILKSLRKKAIEYHHHSLVELIDVLSY